MVTKAQLLESMRHEIVVVKHLAGKVPPTKLDYRPSPGQRSTIELLRYLTWCGLSSATGSVTGNRDHAKGLEAHAAKLRLEDIPAAMDAQADALQRLLATVSEEDLAQKPAAMPWGTPCTLGEALMNSALKYLACYRMQLFLYAKASGAEIGTRDCWAGIDRKPAA